MTRPTNPSSGDPVPPPSAGGGDWYRAALDAAPNAIVAVDAAGTIVYANPRVRATFGHHPEAVIGRHVELLIPERVHDRHRRHRGRYLVEHRARPMGIGLDLSGRRSDGSEFPVEISLAPVETPEGLRVFATVVDITERKAAEAAQAESERRFRAVVEASRDPIIGVDAQGRISYANPQVLDTFGWSPGELEGQPIELLIPERFTDQHRSHRDAFMAAPHARPMGIGLDLWGRRRDGTEFPVEISLSPVATEASPLIFARVVDITQRKALEDQLLQGQKMESIGRLAGGIAHDFNNMLSAINGYTELLMDDINAGTVAPDDLRSSVEAIQAAGERATVLTGQLLAFARRQVVTPMIVDLNTAVAQLEPMIRRLIGERIDLHLSLGHRVGHVRCDPGQLDQIIVNLAVNARDAIEGAGTVVVATDEARFDEAYAMEHFAVTPGTYAMLAVSDTGAGMDRETRTHIFEPFFTTKEVGRGTGLGLATIYGIVQQAGGHIWLYSEPGAGTTFKIYLPLVDQPEENREVVADAAEAAFTGRALVVEDEEMVRGLTVNFLRRSGYEVVEVEDAERALALIAGDDTFHLVVTDVVMPGISGTELADRIRAKHPTIAVVLVSGYTAETLDIEEQLAHGAAFVAKPFSRRQLSDAVAVAVLNAARAKSDVPDARD